MSFLIKDLELALKSISLDGFKFKKVIGGFQWIQKLPNRTNIIGVGHSGYPDLYRTSRPSLRVSYDEVEDILDRVYKETEIKKNFEDRSTIKGDTRNIVDVNYKVFDIHIKDKLNYPQVLMELKKIIQQSALPFFQECNSLEKIAELLADKTPQEVVPYIQGAILFPKTILILKLSNHPSFNTKLLEYYGVLKKQAEKKDTYKDVLTVFLELFKDDLKNLKSPLA